jgi:hypothetical protein
MAPNRGTFCLTVLAAVLCTAAAAGAARAQGAVPPEKDSRTPAQQKMDSQLLYEVYRARGLAARKQVPPGPTGVKTDPRGRALVDIRAEVTPALQEKVRKLGGTIVDLSLEHRSIVAWVPLLQVERLASDTSVRAINPAPEATTIK